MDPYIPAALTAAAHNDSGIRERILCVRRQRSNRPRTPSNRAGRSRVLLALIGCPPRVLCLTAYDTTRLKTIHTRLPEGHDQRGGSTV